MEEYIDVINENGSPTGVKKLKSEVHRGGDWHRAVHVWIVNSKGELLIQKRAPQKDNHPNMWDIPSAGHVSAGETPAICAERETEEELGLTLGAEKFEYLFTVSQKSVSNNGTYINNEINDVFLVRLDAELSRMELQKEEVSEVRFVPFRELEKIIGNGNPDFVSHPEEYKKLFEELHKRFN